jgi:hypothetical protein
MSDDLSFLEEKEDGWLAHDPFVSAEVTIVSASGARVSATVNLAPYWGAGFLVGKRIAGPQRSKLLNCASNLLDLAIKRHPLNPERADV